MDMDSDMDMELGMFLKPLTFLTIMLYTSIALAVDQGSEAYKMGNLVGKVFVGILVFLIVKKIFFSKK